MSGILRVHLRAFVVLVGLCGPTLPTQADPANFPTANAAVSALQAALAKDDVDALVEIFGREHADIVLGADPASGSVMRQRAATMAREKVVLRRDSAERITLVQIGRASCRERV